MSTRKESAARAGGRTLDEAFNLLEDAFRRIEDGESIDKVVIEALKDIQNQLMDLAMEVVGDYLGKAVSGIPYAGPFLSVIVEHGMKAFGRASRSVYI